MPTVYDIDKLPKTQVVPQGAEYTPAIIRLHRTIPHTVPFLDQTITRICLFNLRYGGNPTELREIIWNRFAGGIQSMGLFADIQQGQVVGHVLGFVERWDGKSVAWISQAEHDYHMTRQIRDLWLAYIKDWIRQVNVSVQDPTKHIKEILFITKRPSDAWVRHTGFEPYRTIMRMEVQA